MTFYLFYVYWVWREEGSFLWESCTIPICHNLYYQYLMSINCRSSSQLEFTLELLNYDVPDWKIALVKSKHYEGKHAEMR